MESIPVEQLRVWAGDYSAFMPNGSHPDEHQLLAILRYVYPAGPSQEALKEACAHDTPSVVWTPDVRDRLRAAIPPRKPFFEINWREVARRTGCTAQEAQDCVGRELDWSKSADVVMKTDTFQPQLHPSPVIELATEVVVDSAMEIAAAAAPPVGDTKKRKSEVVVVEEKHHKKQRRDDEDNTKASNLSLDINQLALRGFKKEDWFTKTLDGTHWNSCVTTPQQARPYLLNYVAPPDHDIALADLPEKEWRVSMEHREYRRVWGCSCGQVGFNSKRSKVLLHIGRSHLNPTPATVVSAAATAASATTRFDQLQQRIHSAQRARLEEASTRAQEAYVTKSIDGVAMGGFAVVTEGVQDQVVAEWLKEMQDPQRGNFRWYANPTPGEHRFYFSEQQQPLDMAIERVYP